MGSVENGKPGADVVDLTLDSSSSSEEEEEEEEDEEDVITVVLCWLTRLPGPAL